MDTVDRSDSDAGFGPRVHGLARAGKIHGPDSIGRRFVEIVWRHIDPAEFLEWSVFGGSPFPLRGRRCAGNRVVEIQPVEERLLSVAFAPSPNRESGEI